MENFDPKKDYYQILDIDSNATIEEITDAYYNKAMECLPEHHPVDEEKIWTARLARIQEAFKVLGNSESRRAYDAARYGKVPKDEIVVSRVQDRPIRVQSVEDTPITRMVARNGRFRIGKSSIALAVLVITLSCCLIYYVKKDVKGNDVSKEAINTESLDNIEYMGEQTLVAGNVTEAQQELDNRNIEEVVEASTVTANEDASIYDFYDASDAEQVNKRARAIQLFLQKSNVSNISIEDIEIAIKYINRTNSSVIPVPDGLELTDYNISALKEEHAYACYDKIFEIFENYSRASAQAVNFAGGVVDENGVQVAMGFDALLVDNSRHHDFMDEAAVLFQNVLTASESETKIEASKAFLNQQAKLMLGLLVDDTGTKLDYVSLDESEGFVYGLMTQFAAPIIRSALPEHDDFCLTYTDNFGLPNNINISVIDEYYNPLDCNNNLKETSIWDLDSRELVKQCILLTEVEGLSKDDDGTITLQKTMD